MIDPSSRVLFVGAHCGDEEASAAAALGLSEMRVLRYADAELPESEEVVDQVTDFIRLVRPNVVITHWSPSIHPDHEIARRVTERAVFEAGIRRIATEREAHYASRLLYAENWEDREGFVPHTYIDVTPDWEVWRAAVMCYSLFRGEVVRFPYISYYDHLSQVRGPEAGLERALAFAVAAGALRAVVR